MNKMVLGIDLGTTYSAVAYVDEHGEAKIIPNTYGDRITPSVVFFESENNIIVGQDAKDEMELSPESVVAFVKREMGKHKNEVRKEDNYGEPKPYDFFGKRYSPVEISSFILKKLKKDAENYFNTKKNYDAVITVPAYFNDFERNDTIEAGKLAGLNVLQVINEPTAAALSYGIISSVNQKVFVFDLGGGTFDVTIIDILNGEFKVIATDGDHRLGGKDWDDRIIEYIADEFINEFGEDPRNDLDIIAELKIISEKVKKSLSEKNISTINLKYHGNKLSLNISKEQFKSISYDLLSRIEGLCNTILNQANLTWNDISEIVLAGGSTRLQMVRELIEQISNKKLKTNLVNPDECVALGAAIQGHLIVNKNRLESTPVFKGRIKSIGDVASHSLGFITVKNKKLHNSIMISKNSKIPCKVIKRDFTTSHDNQEILEIHVLQGESTNPDNCTLLYGYEFQDLPKKPKGKVNIEVCFEYNSNGVVVVSAKVNQNKLPFKKIKNPKLPVLQASVSKQLYVIIAIDLSGSMYGTPLTEAKNAALEFISQMNFTNTSMALVPFADRVMVNQNFTRNSNDLTGGVNHWSNIDLGCCNSAEPFEKSLKLMKNQTGKKIIIVLTDGIWSCKEKAIRNAQYCKDNGIEIRAIGFGGADINFLKQLSSSESGYNFTTSGTELTQVMLNIATEISTNKLT